MKLKKTAAAVLSVLLCLTILGGCGNEEGGLLLRYDDCITQDGTYDTSLFYRNDLNLNHAADPDVIWVPEERDEEDGGYFYLYATTIYNNFIAARSRDLNTWEFLGPVIDWSLGDVDQWCTTNLWAPEVIYNDPAKTPTGDGKYYMFFTGGYATMVHSGEFYIGIAVADSPAGPFQYYTGTNLLGEQLDQSRPTIDPNIDHPAYVVDGVTVSENKSAVPVEAQNRNSRHENINYIIDLNPFIDDDGTIYLYIRSQNPYARYAYAHLAVWQMADMVTPLYDTYTQLTYPGYATLEDRDNNIPFEPEEGSNLDEAPHMIKHDGVYYLTYAPIGYGSRTGYSVSVAVSNSPFGPFTKMDREHGNPALNIEAHQDWMAGPGHHCFTEVGDEIFVFYHSLMDRATGNSNPRGIAYDRVTFIDGSNYDIPAEQYGIESETGTFDMLYANGPTWSVQPLPAEITGYRNVAGEATVTADSGADTVKYLNDGLFVAHAYAEHMEYMSEGAATITLTFAEPKEVTAVMIYNSNDYTCAFKYIDSIRFDLSEPPSTYNGDETTVWIRNLGVSTDYYNAAERVMRSGGAAVARFNPIMVNSITIKVSAHLDTSSEAGAGIKISDIAVLAK